MRILVIIMALFTYCTAFDSIKPRANVSNNTRFAAESSWEGVYGELMACNPTSIVAGWCYKQNTLSIYDCYQTNTYRYEDSTFTCKLGLVMAQNPDKAGAFDHLICDTFHYPGEVKIEVSKNSAKPTDEYYENMCSKADDFEECSQNVAFSLTMEKDKQGQNGIRFHSSKGLDSIACETPRSEKFAGTLNAFYPTLNGKNGRGSFDCTKQGLSKVEKGICNNFYLVRDDYELNVVYNFVMNFSDEATKQSVKKEQLAWLKERNLTCNKENDINDLQNCIVKSIRKRKTELKTMMATLKKQNVRLKNPIGEIRIFELPFVSLKDNNVLFVAIENDDYEAFLADRQRYGEFRKIVFHLLDSKRNANKNDIVGFVREIELVSEKCDSVSLLPCER